jgi:hypothetical protein
MREGADRNSSPTSSALAADQVRAERLLFELATDLRFVAVEECTRDLHIRSLEIKGAVRRWIDEWPDARAREATCEEIVALQTRTRLLLGRTARAAGRPHSSI